MSIPNEINLSKPEIYILISIMKNQSFPGEGVSIDKISENLKSVNINDFLNDIDFKININIQRLLKKELIAHSYESQSCGLVISYYHAYSLTQPGVDWLLENESTLNDLLS